MNDNRIGLFKQALNEGVSEKIDSIVNSCSEKVVCSRKHMLAMRTLVYGKSNVNFGWSPKTKRAIAILIAIALLLTSCGIIFRNQIKEIVNDLYAKYTYDGEKSDVLMIEDIYELKYLPDGFSLEDKSVSYTATRLKYSNPEGDYLYFEQSVLNGSTFVVDSESGYSKITEIKEYNIYCRHTKELHSYIWTDGKYAFILKSKEALSDENLKLIIEAIK